MWSNLSMMFHLDLKSEGYFFAYKHIANIVALSKSDGQWLRLRSVYEIVWRLRCLLRVKIRGADKNRERTTTTACSIIPRDVSDDEAIALTARFRRVIGLSPYAETVAFCADDTCVTAEIHGCCTNDVRARTRSDDNTRKEAYHRKIARKINRDVCFRTRAYQWQVANLRNIPYSHILPYFSYKMRQTCTIRTVRFGGYANSRVFRGSLLKITITCPDGSTISSLPSFRQPSTVAEQLRNSC